VSAPLPRRDALRLLGLGAAGAALTGCASATAGPGVTWQAYPSYSLQGTSRARVAYLRAALDAFRSRSRLPIVPEVSSSDTAAAMAKLLLQASQRRAPDLAQVDSSIFGRMAPYARPLTDPMARAGLRREDWLPALRELMAGPDGVVRGLPFTTDVRVLYYRKDLVPAPPSTWDELIATGVPLARRGHVMLFPAGRSEGAVINTLWPQYWSHGVSLFDAAGEPAFRSGVEYRAMLDSLRLVQRCVQSGITPTRVSTFGSEDEMSPDVVAGRVAMFVGGSWQASALAKATTGGDFYRDWDVAPIPSLSGDRHVTTAGGWLWSAFSADRDRADVGIDWVTEAFVSETGMARWCGAAGYLPARESVYDNPAYHQDPFTATFRDHLSRYARTRPADRKYLEVSSAMQIALSAVASGASDAGQALDAALHRLV
jgi:multiple sugar transport system substrate-binding protein